MINIVSHNNPKSTISEAYRMLRTNIEFSNLDQDLKTIVVTSSKQNEGKTTIVANLAVSFAHLENKKVLIIDGDLRNPSIHRMFNITNSYGLTDVLTGKKSLETCLQASNSSSSFSKEIYICWQVSSPSPQFSTIFPVIVTPFPIDPQIPP